MHRPGGSTARSAWLRRWAASLDPALKKRGFASRDILTHWPTIAPTPYDKVTRPDKLSWPRGEKGAEGATLYLRCLPGHALALAHEGQRIAAAINRYFGYLLVGAGESQRRPIRRRGRNPRNHPGAAGSQPRPHQPEPVDDVSDPGVRDALRELGQAIARKKAR